MHKSLVLKAGLGTFELVVFDDSPEPIGIKVQYPFLRVVMSKAGGELAINESIEKTEQKIGASVDSLALELAKHIDSPKDYEGFCGDDFASLPYIVVLYHLHDFM